MEDMTVENLIASWWLAAVQDINPAFSMFHLWLWPSRNPFVCTVKTWWLHGCASILMEVFLVSKCQVYPWAPTQSWISASVYKYSWRVLWTVEETFLITCLCNKLTHCKLKSTVCVCVSGRGQEVRVNGQLWSAEVPPRGGRWVTSEH